MSSPILLYLSRHGETLNNKLQEEHGTWHSPEWTGLPGLKELTEKGREQARILAQYAGLFLFQGVPADRIGVLSSGEQRSNDTAEEIVRYNRLPIFNFKKTPLLREQVPKELITPEPCACERYLRWYNSLKPREDIAEQFSSELEFQLRGLARDVDCRAVIAPLHGNVNAVFLEHIGAEPIMMGNCSVIPIRYEDGRFEQVGDYTTNDEMIGLLEG